MNMHSTYPTPFDKRELRDVLGQFATGVAVATTCGKDNLPIGLAINSFASVSLEPPEILWSVQSDAPSKSAFESHKAFAINVMPEGEKEQTMNFARPSDTKFENVKWRRGWKDVPVLECAMATFECDVKQMIPCGDHHIIVGSVRAIDRQEGDPLVFFRGQFAKIGDAL